MKLRKNEGRVKAIGRLGVILTAVFVLVIGNSASAFAGGGIHVDSHSQAEIRAYMEKIYKNRDFAVKYAEEPVAEGPAYSAGMLSDETLQGAVNMLNGMRYIAGVPANVTLNEEYTRLCQAASLVNCANQEMSHSPARPKGMSDALYQLGYKGCSSSNLSWGSYDFQEALINWVSDEFNVITDPGHRRWCLNPAMGSTGFGKVGSHSSMYAFDKSNSEAAGYVGVAWPAEQMPINYFNPNIQWSVSFGRRISQEAVDCLLYTSPSPRDCS